LSFQITLAQLLLALLLFQVFGFLFLTVLLELLFKLLVLFGFSLLLTLLLLRLILSDVMQVEPGDLPLAHLLQVDPPLLFLLELLSVLLHLFLYLLHLVFLKLLNLRICTHLGLYKCSSLQLLLTVLIPLLTLLLHPFLVGDLFDLVPHGLGLPDLPLVLDRAAECGLDLLALDLLGLALEGWQRLKSVQYVDALVAGFDLVEVGRDILLLRAGVRDPWQEDVLLWLVDGVQRTVPVMLQRDLRHLLIYCHALVSATRIVPVAQHRRELLTEVEAGLLGRVELVHILLILTA
jgi:hypothetical protein